MFSCFFVRPEGLYWFTYYLRFDDRRNYERFLGGALLDELIRDGSGDECLSFRRGDYSDVLLPVPDGHYRYETLSQSDSKEEAICLARRALEDKTSIVHEFGPVDPRAPIFVEIDSHPVAIDRSI